MLWDADEVFSFLERYYGGEGDRSAPMRPELSLAERSLLHPGGSESGATDAAHAGGAGSGAAGGEGKGIGLVRDPDSSGTLQRQSKGDGEPRRRRDHPHSHRHHSGRPGVVTVTVSPDDDRERGHSQESDGAGAGTGTGAGPGALHERVERDFSGRRKKSGEEGWAHSVSESLRPGADPLETFAAQQGQLRKAADRAAGRSKAGAGGSAGAGRAVQARPPRRRYHAPGGLHPLVFVAACSFSPVLVYAGWVYARAIFGGPPRVKKGGAGNGNGNSGGRHAGGSSWFPL